MWNVRLSFISYLKYCKQTQKPFTLLNERQSSNSCFYIFHFCMHGAETHPENGEFSCRTFPFVLTWLWGCHEKAKQCQLIEEMLMRSISKLKKRNVAAYQVLISIGQGWHHSSSTPIFFILQYFLMATSLMVLLFEMWKNSLKKSEQ